MFPKEMIQIQTHHHTKCCKKHKHSSYRFGFPFLSIDEACILQPLSNENSGNQEMHKKRYSLLKNKAYIENIIIDHFLVVLELPKRNT